MWRMAGWKTGAKQKVMPSRLPASAAAAAGRSMTTPRASSMSADPLWEEAARLPCLATRAPAAAATTAAIVEMLTVCERSPPVPQVSTTGPSMSSGTLAFIMPVTRPDTSRAVSPLARRATRKAAVLAGGADPVSISAITHVVVGALRSSPASSASRTSTQSVRGASFTGAWSPARRVRSSPDTASASWPGSIGWPTTASARDHVASQASCGRPVSTRMGGQRWISSLSWRVSPRPPVGVASPSRIIRSSPPASAVRSTTGPVATSTNSSSGRSGSGRVPRAVITARRTVRSSL